MIICALARLWGFALVFLVGTAAYLATVVKSVKQEVAAERIQQAAAEQAQARETRLRYLHERHGDADVVDRILAGEVWRGQTEAQLRDSMGEPDTIEERALKTKTKVVWKYDYGYGSKVTVTMEEGIVVAYTKRD